MKLRKVMAKINDNVLYTIPLRSAYNYLSLESPATYVMKGRIRLQIKVSLPNTWKNLIVIIWNGIFRVCLRPMIIPKIICIIPKAA